MKITSLSEVVKAQLNELIISLRASGVSFRDISKQVQSVLNLDLSHTSISNYYKNDLNGSVIDKAIQSDGLPLIGKPAFNGELFDRIKLEVEGEDIMSEIYAQILTLCKSNIQAHIDGREDLKPKYIKYLRDLKILEDSRN